MGWVKRKRRGRSSPPPPPPPPSRPGMFQPRRRNDPSFASLQQPLKQPSRATQTAAAAVLLVSINESKHTLPPPLQPPPPQLDATQVCHRLVTELSYPEREQRETPPLPSHPTTTRSTDQEKESHPPPSAPRTITYVFSDSIDA